MRYSLNKKEIIGLIINIVAVLVLYTSYSIVFDSITGSGLTDFGSLPQVGGSYLYISYTMALVVLIMQIIIIILKRLAIFFGLDQE